MIGADYCLGSRRVSLTGAVKQPIKEGEEKKRPEEYSQSPLHSAYKTKRKRGYDKQKRCDKIADFATKFATFGDEDLA